jgi:hypothetical protein
MKEGRQRIGPTYLRLPAQDGVQHTLTSYQDLQSFKLSHSCTQLVELRTQPVVHFCRSQQGKKLTPILLDLGIANTGLA